jgi:hypothetical protein
MPYIRIKSFKSILFWYLQYLPSLQVPTQLLSLLTKHRLLSLYVLLLATPPQVSTGQEMACWLPQVAPSLLLLLRMAMTRHVTSVLLTMEFLQTKLQLFV